jgi:hypothetical protein
MLREQLSDHQLGYLFRLDTHLFFVDRRFQNLRGNIKPAKQALDTFVDALSRPARDEIEAIANPDEPLATALPRILRLAKVLEAAIRHGNHEAIAYFQLDRGNPFDAGQGTCVVPSIYGIEPSRLRDVRRRVKGDDRGFKAFLQAAGKRSVNANMFESFLEDGAALKQRGKFRYLVTRATAQAIFDYLSKCSVTNNHQDGGLGAASVDELFVSDPADFPGVGRCEALPVRFGNLLS